MIDTILTICSVLIFTPWIIKTCSLSWNNRSWHRQLFIACLTLELVSILYIPSIMYICIGVLVFAFGIYLVIERPKVHVTPIFIIALLYFLWYAISLLWSAVPKKGIQFLLDNGLVLVCISSMSCFLVLKKEESIEILQQFCYASCIFIALSILSWIVSSWELQLSLWNWPILEKETVCRNYSYSWIFRFLGGIDGYIHPSYNLLPVFVSIPIAAWLKKHNNRHIMWIFLWMGAFILTLLSQSRMGIIYATIVLIGNIIYLLPSKKHKIIIATCLCVCGLIAFGYSRHFWKTYGTDNTRDILETYTLRYVQVKPFTGAGAGTLNPIEVCRTINENYWPNVGYIDINQDIANWKPKTHMLPHNQWLADWAHAGILAAIITTLLYLCCMIRSITTKNYWGCIFIFIFCIFSLLEPPLYIGKGFYLFCFLSCIVYIAPSENQQLPITSQHCLIGIKRKINKWNIGQ